MSRYLPCMEKTVNNVRQRKKVPRWRGKSLLAVEPKMQRETLRKLLIFVQNDGKNAQLYLYKRHMLIL